MTSSSKVEPIVRLPDVFGLPVFISQHMSKDAVGMMPYGTYEKAVVAGSKEAMHKFVREANQIRRRGWSHHAGGFKCFECKKHRNSIRSMQRHLKQSHHT